MVISHFRQVVQSLLCSVVGVVAFCFGLHILLRGASAAAAGDNSITGGTHYAASILRLPMGLLFALEPVWNRFWMMAIAAITVALGCTIGALVVDGGHPVDFVVLAVFPVVATNRWFWGMDRRQPLPCVQRKGRVALSWFMRVHALYHLVVGALLVRAAVGHFGQRPDERIDAALGIAEELEEDSTATNALAGGLAALTLCGFQMSEPLWNYNSVTAAGTMSAAATASTLLASVTGSRSFVGITTFFAAATLNRSYRAYHKQLARNGANEDCDADLEPLLVRCLRGQSGGDRRRVAAAADAPGGLAEPRVHCSPHL